jgi:UDP-N-acetylglucosamine--N-acetylmuramyl-(pentapeptide) pyrophosphoryl-undecaprenol N-acetylglucosamine transferase
VPGEYEGWSQAPNADFLEQHGAATALQQDHLDRLPDVVLALLRDKERLRSMRAAMAALARPDAARDLARVLLEVAT